jgi:hypothetical protein
LVLAREVETGRESDTVEFFNVVGLLAFMCASVIEKHFEKNCSPQLRFCTMLRRDHPFPLSIDNQDHHPAFIALPYCAFAKSGTESTRPPSNGFCRSPSPLTRMQEMFPMCYQEPRIRETVSSSKKHQEAAVFFHTTEVLHTPGKPHNLANSADVNNCDTRNRLERIFKI